MINLIFISAVSATFELENNKPYFAPDPFNVSLNGQRVLEDVKTNVFSLYDLKPDTTYLLSVNDTTLEFKTEWVSETINVKNFGAVGDGVNDDTKALQAAIDLAKDYALIEISGGTFWTGPLFLKSHRTIHIQQNAILLGETDRSKYPILEAQKTHSNGEILELSSWEGVPAPTFASVITGILVKNVKIVGQGIIDENAQNSDWWLNHKVMRGGAWRPKGVFLSHCEQIGLQGITIKNTPSWNLHPYFSNKLDFIDLKIESPHDSPNTDGCDPESCSDVNVIGVNFSVGDDCIAIKSGKYELGMKYRKPTERMIIRNCYMAFGHGAVVLGSETSGGVKDLTVTKCYFYQTDRGLRIKTRRGRGESMRIDGIVFDNIIMDDVKVPLVMNMYYYCDDDGKTEYVWSKEALKVDEKTPYLGRFVFKNVVATNAHAAAGFFYGLKEQPIESIMLENVSISFSKHAQPFVPAMMSFQAQQLKQGLQFRNVNEVILNEVTLSGIDGDPVLLENVHHFNKQ